MYCTKKITDDLIWVGANDRRLAMFEGVYSVPRGVSYNAYLLLDDINVLFDTVDKAVGKTFFENLAHALNGKNLDFVVIQHMEPDHSATLMELLLRYPNAKVVCNQKILTMIQQFFQLDLSGKAFVVKENDTLSRRAQANELLVSAQAALEQGDYAALRSHLEALGAYADALKDDGAALYETLRSYID